MTTHRSAPHDRRERPRRQWPTDAARREASRQFRQGYKGPTYVYVANLCPTVTLLDVEKAFRPRSVRWIEIYVSQGLARYVKDKSHIPEGLETEKYAIVHFKDGIWAYKALRENGKILNGRPMLVTPYFSETPTFKTKVLGMSSDQVKDTIPGAVAHPSQPPPIIDV